jgi:protein-disulfide isomerase-like protein with CxxC motif
MLKLTQIDGRDALTFSLPCGCGVIGSFALDAEAGDMAMALIAFAEAVNNLETMHELKHRADIEGREVTPAEVSAALGVAVDVVVDPSNRSH